jgi:hypothetical protein
MAVRTGAGTGVIVSLVVFVIATVSLLVLAIAFYAGLTDAREQQAEAQRALSVYALPQQRNQDLFRTYEAAAAQRNESVAQHLHNRIEALMRYVDGSPTTTPDQLRAKLVRYGVSDTGVVANVLSDRSRDLQQCEQEVEGLQNQLAGLNRRISDMETESTARREAHQTELMSVQGQIAGYRQAAEEYRDELQTTKREMNAAVDRLHDRFDGRIRDLEGEVDDLHRERVQLMDRVQELQARLSADRLRAQDPSTLVDGRIIDTQADQVFIDRGRRHRIVLGMTFEVYDDPAAIRVDERTGELPRGKASIQVVRIGDTTSTAKIIRSVPGRPVVRENVIANAVYDPDYRFKFLVHGRFDINGDGRATEADAEYLRTKIVEWGGVVVHADEIPGDLDFLVLGVRPDEPPPPGAGADEHMFQDYLLRLAARQRYDNLFRQARDSQIPVLNHNRFLVLIGHTER